MKPAFAKTRSLLGGSAPGTLPFSCPFGAAKRGKGRQRAAQGEAEKPRDSSGSHARCGNCRQRPAKGVWFAKRPSARRRRHERRPGSIGRGFSTRSRSDFEHGTSEETQLTLGASVAAGVTSSAYAA